MKAKAYFLAVFIFAGMATAYAQPCTPDPSYQDSTYGAWPDTIENFPLAEIGVYYSTVLDFKVPTDAGDIDPLFAGNDINWFKVTDVPGLPPGLSYQCDVPSCQWPGGTQGCALIDGTPTQLGIFEITIEVTAEVEIFAGTIEVPYTFEGYRINVTAVGIDPVKGNQFMVQQNNPNPFVWKTDILFYSPGKSTVEFEVYNLLGEKVHQRSILAKNGANTIEFIADKLPHGVYMYSISNGERAFTKRMIIADR